MVTGMRRLSTAFGLGVVIASAGCMPARAPQYTEDPSKPKMTEEQAAAAKAKSAEEFSKGYQEAAKRFGAKGANPPAPPGK